MIHRFSVTNHSFIKKIKNDSTEKNNNINYFFLSDFDYKYEHFYEIISNFRFKESKIHLNNLNINLTVNEFNVLKSHYSDIKMLNYFFNEFKNNRLKLLMEKEIIARREKEGCYIATMVYKNYDHPEVLILRHFRDQNLQLYLLGRIFIRKYYKYSPQYVNYVKDKKVLNYLSKIIIFLIVKILKKVVK